MVSPSGNTSGHINIFSPVLASISRIVVNDPPAADTRDSPPALVATTIVLSGNQTAPCGKSNVESRTTVRGVPPATGTAHIDRSVSPK